VRLVLNGEKVVAEEKLLENLSWRIREVKQGPDGAIYIFAGNRLVRLVPRYTLVLNKNRVFEEFT